MGEEGYSETVKMGDPGGKGGFAPRSMIWAKIPCYGNCS